MCALPQADVWLILTILLPTYIRFIIQASSKFAQEGQGFARQTINEPICATLYQGVINQIS